MFQKMNLQTKLLSSFGLMGGLVLVVGLVGLNYTSRLSSHVTAIGSNNLPSVEGLWKVNEGQTQIESSERSLLNTNLSSSERQSEIKRMNQAWEQINDGFKEYQATPREPEEDKLYKQMLVDWDKWKQAHEELLRINQDFERNGILDPLEAELRLNLQGKSNSSEMVAVKTAESIFRKLQDQARANRAPFETATASILKVADNNHQQAIDETKAGSEDIKESSFWMVLSMLGGTSVAIVFSIFLTNAIAKPMGAKIAGVVGVAEKISTGDLTTSIQPTEDLDEVGKLQNAFHYMSNNLNSLIRQVQQSVVQITTSATQIAASGKELEASVAEQVASTNEVAATAKEISATSAYLAKTMDEVEHAAQKSAQAAGDGKKDLHQMETTMRTLADATGTISTKLGMITDKANNINTIIITITKVADQTNLLSLNAAIEAEKAGEYGKGFAVVAREIRRLADQTAVATLDIEKMVKEMQGAVSTGVTEMDKFTKQVELGVQDVQNISTKLELIIEQVQALTPRIDQVSQGMQAQSEGAVQISEAMGQLSEAVSQTAASLREINGAIGQLNGASHSLRQEISHFKVADSSSTQPSFA